MQRLSGTDRVRPKANATFATSKRAERDLSTSIIREQKQASKKLAAEITEMSGKSRIFDKINSNMRSGVQINMEAIAPRSPK